MKLKIYKPVLLTAAGLMIACSAGFAQKKHHHKVKEKHTALVTVNVDDNDFEIDMSNLAKDLKANFKDFGKNLAATITNNISENVKIDLDDSEDAGDIDVN